MSTNCSIKPNHASATTTWGRKSVYPRLALSLRRIGLVWLCALGGLLLVLATPASGEDPYDPNDSAQQATGPVAVGSPYGGAFETSNDVDWFFYDSAGAAQIDISLTATGTCGVGLRFKNADQSEIARIDADPGGQTQHILQTVGKARYLLELTRRYYDSPGAGCNYQFRIDPVNPPGGQQASGHPEPRLTRT
jgi:hypothetical protein